MTLLGFAQIAQADCPSSADRFLAQNDQVTDKKTGLIWARCSVGQSWDGESCKGAATTLTFKQAEEVAAKSEGWRLPEVEELLGIVDYGCRYPSIDSEVFPNTPRLWYWTSSEFPWSRGTSVWVILFAEGNYDGFAKGYDHLIVRLVRSTE